MLKQNIKIGLDSPCLTLKPQWRLNNALWFFKKIRSYISDGYGTAKLNAEGTRYTAKLSIQEAERIVSWLDRIITHRDVMFFPNAIELSKYDLPVELKNRSHQTEEQAILLHKDLKTLFRSINRFEIYRATFTIEFVDLPVNAQDEDDVCDDDDDDDDDDDEENED